MTRKALSIILILALVLVGISTVGCSSKQEPEKKESEVKTFNLKLATWAPPDHPLYARVMAFKEKVEKESNGTIKIKVYPADQLGDYTLVLEEVMKGTIEIAMNSLASKFDPRIEALYLHYLVKNYDDVRKVYSPGSYMNDLMDKILDEKNVKLLGWDCLGFGGLGFKKKPENIFEPGKDKGIVIRSSPNEIFRQWAEDMGFKTVTVPYAELSTALQTGVADGWTGGQPTVNYTSFRDIIKYYVQYNNFTEMCAWMVNKDIYEAMSPEQQKILADAAKEAQEKSLVESERDDKFYMEKLQEAGIEVITLTDEQLKVIADYTYDTTWKKMEGTIGKDVIENIVKSLK